MSTFAIVVGLERYGESAINVSGPAAGALGIVEWLLGLEVPGPQIFLFITIKDNVVDAALDECVNRLAVDKRVRVTRSGEHHLIDNCLRKELPAVAEATNAAGARMLFYWSGHGYVGRSGIRYWLCEDFRLPNQTNRVFDGRRLCRLLASYGAFIDQFVLVDTCAVPAEVTFDPAPDGERAIHPDVVQRGIFAALEGFYARAGEFSIVVAQHLVRRGWPADGDALLALVENVRSDIKQVMSYDLIGEHERSGRFGRPRLSTAGASALALLNSVTARANECLLCYQRSVNSRGGYRFLAARQPYEMISTLDRMGDDAGDTSDALVEFMLRLSKLDTHNAKFGGWIDAYSTQIQVETIQETLAAQSARRILAVDIGHQSELITSFQCFVRTLDLRPLPEPDRVRRFVSGWDSFAADFQQELAVMRGSGMIGDDFDIEFLVDAPLFHLPFHQIPLEADGPPLGNEYVVVTRYQRRSVKHDRMEDWRNFAKDIGSNAPTNVPLRRLERPDTQEAIAGLLRTLLERRGLYYTGFTLSKDARHDGRIQAMLKLLNFGVPYLLWFHEPHSNSEWQEFEAWLRDLLVRLEQDGRALVHFPHTIPPVRNAGDAFAANVTIMWDDPLTHPLLRRRLVSPT